MITDRRLLRELGFLRPVQGGPAGVDGDDDEEEELEEDPLDDLAPAAAIAPAMPAAVTATNTKVGMPGSNPFTE